MNKISYLLKSLKPFNENSNYNNNVSRASSMTSACDFTRLDEIKKYSNISTAPSSFWPSSKKSFMSKTKIFLDDTKNRVSFCFSLKKSDSKVKSKLKAKAKKISQHSFFSKLFRNLGISSRKLNKDKNIEHLTEVLAKLNPILDFLSHSENIKLLKSLIERHSNENTLSDIIKVEMERFKSELGPLLKALLNEYFDSSPIIEKKLITPKKVISNEDSKEEDVCVVQAVSTKISERIKKFDNLIKQNQTNVSKSINQIDLKSDSKQGNKFGNVLELANLKRNLNEMIEKKQLSLSIDEYGKSSNSKRPSRLLATKDSLIVLKNIHDKQPNDNNSIVSFSYLNELQVNSSFSSISFNSKSNVMKSKSSNDIGLKKVSFDLNKTSLDNIDKNIFLSAKEFEYICESKYLNSKNIDIFLDLLMKKLAKIREEDSIPSDIELMSERDIDIEKAFLQSVLNRLESIARNTEFLDSNENYLELKKRLSLIKLASNHK